MTDVRCPICYLRREFGHFPACPRYIESEELAVAAAEEAAKEAQFTAVKLTEMRCEDCYVGEHYDTSWNVGVGSFCPCCLNSIANLMFWISDRHHSDIDVSAPSRAPEPEYKDALTRKIGYSLADLVDDKLCTLNDELTRKPRLSRKELKRQLREVLEERNSLKDRVGELKQELETTLGERTEARNPGQSLARNVLPEPGA